MQHHLSDSLFLANIIIVGGFGGRFDHELANIHALYRWQGVFYRVIMLDSQGYTELLEPQIQHRIQPIRTALWEEGYACGLLPMGGKVDNVTTQGLMWNLTQEPLAFGHRISSSNIIPTERSEVIVEVSHSIIWTCSFKNLSEI